MQRQTILRAAAGLLVLAGIWLGWLIFRSAGVPFLPPHFSAQWITFPVPTTLRLQPVVELPATFRTHFSVTNLPDNMTLTVRAFRTAEVRVNGHLVEVPPVNNWKQAAAADIAGYLEAGENQIQVTVANDAGPPALWFHLAGGEVSVSSDRSWEVSYAGSAWQPAAFASEAPRVGLGNPYYGREPSQESFRRSGGWLALFTLAAAGAVFIGFKWRGRRTKQALILHQHRNSLILDPEPRWPWMSDPAALFFVGSAVLFSVLVIHNIAQNIPDTGASAAPHIEYIKQVEDQFAPPAPGDNSAIAPPPLYYLVCGGIMKATFTTVDSGAGLALLCVFSLGVSLVQFALVFACLRLLFEGQTSRQIVGLTVAGYLPARIQLTHYLTNDLLAACLATAVFYQLLKIIRNRDDSRRAGIVLGIYLGLAALTHNAMIFLLPLAGIILLHRFKQTDLRGRRRGVPALGAAIACLVVCGWYYWDLWATNGGRLFTAAAWQYSGAAWQNPGYHTAAYFSSFGRSLTEPFFSGWSGFFDGLYSTWWGDGLWGGASGLNTRPPWNYRLMAAGYILAAFPTALIFLGLGGMLRRFRRAPDPFSLIVLGLCLGAIFILAGFNLVCPAMAATNAQGGLAALAAVSILAAGGWTVWPEKTLLSRAVVGMVLGVWALTSYGSYWILGDAPATHLLTARALMEKGFPRTAQDHLERALFLDSENVAVRSLRVAELVADNQLDQAERLALLAVRDHPREAVYHLDLAKVLAVGRHFEEAVMEAESAVNLAPDDGTARLELARLYWRLNRYPETIKAGREGLALDPTLPELHSLLGNALVAAANLPTATPAWSAATPPAPSAPTPVTVNELLTREGMTHLSYVGQMEPRSAEPLKRLAWIMATHPNAQLRDGQRSQALALRACMLTNQRDPEALLSLAAAYAENGKFTIAVTTANIAGKLAVLQEKRELAERGQKLVELFQQEQPFRQTRQSVKIGG